jgi:hypothetical protein
MPRHAIGTDGRWIDRRMTPRHGIGHRIPLARHLLLSLGLVSAVAAAAFAQASAAASASAKTWIGDAARMEAHLRTAEIVSLADIGTGVTLPRRGRLKPAEPFESLAWKALPPGFRRGHWESYKSEIAAYELDKLLGMNMVPPAVERRFDGELGAAIMWLEPTTSVKQRGGKVPTGPAFAKPIRMMQMFDNLIGNVDRNAGNILIDQANNVILIDHSRAFTTTADLPWKFERVDAALWNEFQALTSERLTAALGQWLDADAIRSIIGRRDRMVARVDKLVSQKGVAATIIR